MNNELTPEEEQLLSKFKALGKWDHLIYDLSVLIPCLIIMAMGIYFKSSVAVIVGMGVYATIRVYNSVGQSKSIPTLKSLLTKLENSNQSSDPT